MSRLQDLNCLPFRECLEDLDLDDKGYEIYVPNGRHVIPGRTVSSFEEYRDLIESYRAHISSRKKGAHSAH